MMIKIWMEKKVNYSEKIHPNWNLPRQDNNLKIIYQTEFLMPRNKKQDSIVSRI